MRVVLQRVQRASVRVEEEIVGAIGSGFLALTGIANGDEEATIDAMAAKVAGLRIFSDADDKFNLALADVGGAVLVVSQFTLIADVRKGRRPSGRRGPRSRSRWCSDSLSGCGRPVYRWRAVGLARIWRWSWSTTGPSRW